MGLRLTARGSLAVAALGLTGACSTVLAACGHQASSPPRPVATGSGSCFVGQLVANEKMDHSIPADYCADGKHYVGADYRLSRINLFGVRGLPDGWLGKYVMVFAERRPHLAKKLRLTGPCPEGEPFPIQAREDWSPEEGGYLTSSKRLAGADYLEATAEPRLVSLIEVRRPERTQSRGKSGTRPRGPIGEVVVEVHNTLSAPLDQLQVVFHYEGGPGKPLPYYDTAPVRGLAPGQRLELRRPAAIERPVREGRTSWWHFVSVALEGRAGDCEVLPNTYRR